MTRRVVIVGGGLAGIAAAVRLAGRGWEPIIIETRSRLGGRATSFDDPRSGRRLDNCQHVLLGCCTNLIDLYERLGVLDSIEWHRTLYWTRGGGLVDALRAGWLPAPFHLARSFGRMRIFPAAQRRAIARGTWKLIRAGSAGCVRWRGRTFVEFLRECGQPEDVIADFWNTVIVSACNLDVERVSAAAAMHVFQEGFLAHRWSYTMGLASVPLVELYDPAEKFVREAGGAIHLGVSARAIAWDGKRVTGVVTDEGLVEGAAVIAAVPFDRLSRLVSTALRSADRRLQALDRLEPSAILGVHLHFDRPVMELPHLVVVGRGVQWIFNKGIDDEGRQHVHAVVSGAEEWMALDEAEIVRRVVDDVHHVMPWAKGIEPVEARAIKERRATFALTPEAEGLRPPGAPSHIGLGGGVPNLYLAGDWIDTGWPATMEGAVRSGYEAAGAFTGEGGVIEDVRASWLARLLGM